MATSTNERAIAGPAPGLPKEVERVSRYCSRGAFRTEETCSFCPAIAVPITVKIPDPITAPMPSDVRLSQPSDFFNRTSAFSESDSSWSMLLQRNSGDATQALRSHPGAPTVLGDWPCSVHQAGHAMWECLRPNVSRVRLMCNRTGLNVSVNS